MNTIGVEIREDGTVKRSTDNVTTKREQKHGQVSAQGIWKLCLEPRTALVLSCLLPVLWLFIGSSAFAQSAAKESADSLAAHVPGSVSGDVTFASGSAWHISVGAVDKFGLVISHAQFKKPASPTLINVLYDGRIAEIFVPYHAGAPRFFDISGFNFHPLPLNAKHCPAPRALLPGSLICKEVRSYLLWTNGANARYGEEVIYFSILQAGNYNYIMEWTFRDDGTILARAGSTGPRHAASTDGHMHNFTWRLDIDLNGAHDDFVYFTRHVEPFFGALRALDDHVLIAAEGNRIWNPLEFNTVEVCDKTLKNARGRQTCYELAPSRKGTSRHNEPYTLADFWFTQWVGPSDELAINLPGYIIPATDLNPSTNPSADVVVWYTGSVHHETNMRDEDLSTTPVLWVGFELVPKNLFDDTPYYP